jgi:predicted aspartyl protease
MTNFTARGACAAFLLFALASGTVSAQSPPPSRGDAALVAGDFDAAATAYAADLAANPNDADAELGIGTVELYRNHLDAARAHLQRALTLAPGSVAAQARLTDIARRTGGPSDYRIAFSQAQARIPLVAIDPLPTLRATIDGVPVTLMIDTGAPGLVVRQALVEKLHLATKSAGEGVFAGGLKAPIRTTYIDRLDLPGVTVSGIPAGLLPSGAPGGPDGPDGVIGTDFLYHFLATIDYGHAELVLRPAGDSAAFLAAAGGSGATVVPMWLYADHFILVRARVNDAPEALYVIDTGGPGVGVDLTKPELAAAGITPDASHVQYMQGGGGAAPVLPFTAASVAIGDVALHDLPGVYFRNGSPPFPFARGGTISHEFFRHTSVTFDFSSMKVIIERRVTE